VLESDLRENARFLIEASGGTVLPFVSPGRRGMPDRIVLWPGGKAHFIEFKKSEKAPFQPLQPETIAALRELGFTVLVVWNIEQIHEYLRNR
jgi:hypothetical protein